MAFVVQAPMPGNGRLLAVGTRDVLAALARHHARLMQSGATLPPLYQSGVEFRPEPNEGDGHEDWADPWTTARRGWGDCDDLVLWRLAELYVAGEDKAMPAVAYLPDDTMHVFIRRANGDAEDPAKFLLERAKGPRCLSL